jgi:hypothetical protein
MSRRTNSCRGAEDKFPVLIYAVIRASIPLFSNYYFLSMERAQKRSEEEEERGGG